MARRHKRLWTDDEKRLICSQTAAPGVSVAQVAQRYALNANLIFKWLRDPRYALESETTPAEEAHFLPVEIIDVDDAYTPADEGSAPGAEPDRHNSQLEIDLAGGHRLRVIGPYDVEALAVLIRRLSP